MLAAGPSCSAVVVAVVVAEAVVVESERARRDTARARSIVVSMASVFLVQYGAMRTVHAALYVA